MQYEDPAMRSFMGENIDIGLNPGDPRMYNPNFGSTYNYNDDHIYGYGERPVSQIAKERLTKPNGLNYDNYGRNYPGPQPPQDYSYFTQRDAMQGFKSGMTDAAKRDYAILISSNVHYFVLLMVVIFIVIISLLNTVLLFSIWRGSGR